VLLKNPTRSKALLTLYFLACGLLGEALIERELRPGDEARTPQGVALLTPNSDPANARPPNNILRLFSLAEATHRDARLTAIARCFPPSSPTYSVSSRPSGRPGGSHSELSMLPEITAHQRFAMLGGR